MTSRRPRKTKQAPPAVKYCFTLNNPEDVNAPLELTDVKYLIWQYEFGESGTPHLQGFIWLARKKRITALQKEMKASYFPAKGTPTQNYRYCSKCCDDYKLPGHRCKETRLLGPYEVGVLPKANGSIALQTMAKMLKDGKSLGQVYDAFPAMYMRYYRALEHVQTLIHNNNASRGRPTIIWLWGASGTGKSRAIRSAFPNAYIKPRGKWWPKYQYEECVIFDEFDGWMEFKELLQVVDWHAHKTEFKGGYINLKANTFIFASNVDPRSLYLRYKWVQRQALFRRLSEFATVYKWDSSRFVKDDITSYYTSMNEDHEEHDFNAENQHLSHHTHRFNPY